MLALALMSTTACGGDDGGSEPQDPIDDHRVGPIECPDDLPEMREDMEGTSDQGNIEARLVTADKIPLGWYHNDWVVKFIDTETGEPVEDIMFGLVRPWMPLHSHDGNGQFPDITELDNGEWSFEGINITMGGVWEFQIPINESSAGADNIVFRVCNSQPKPKPSE